MPTIDISDSFVNIKCKDCGDLNLLINAKGKEDLAIIEEYSGCVKWKFTCPYCKKKHVYLMSDLVIMPVIY